MKRKNKADDINDPDPEEHKHDNEMKDDSGGEAEGENVTSVVTSETETEAAADVNNESLELDQAETETNTDVNDEEEVSTSCENSEEIEGVIENPLFEPVEQANSSAAIEKFSLDNLDDEDLDFEPDVDENEARKNDGLEGKDDDSEKKGGSDWTENISSPERVDSLTNKTIDDTVETIDEVIISDTDDIDELGDKIDAAYPGSKDKVIDDEESDDEKRGWRSEKTKSNSNPNKKSPRRSSPRRRRVSPPRSRPARRRSRSSSIEIVSVNSRSRDRRRHSILPNGRVLSRSRSRDKYIRRSITPPSYRASRDREDLRYERMETERMRRQVEDLRDTMQYDSGGYSVRDRLGRVAPQRSPPRSSKPRDDGHKLIVKNFPSSMSESEFYSMFIRKGEMISCKKHKDYGEVVYKAKISAENAVKTLNGTKNGNLTLSVKYAPVERRKPSPDRFRDNYNDRLQDRYNDRYNDIPDAPPAPTGIFSRIGNRDHHSSSRFDDDLGRYDRESDLRDRLNKSDDDYDLRSSRAEELQVAKPCSNQGNMK